MKKIICFVLVLLFVALTPKSNAYALDLSAYVPNDTNNAYENEVFMTYEESLSFFEWDCDLYWLKECYQPTKIRSELVKERFFDRLYRVEGEYYDFLDLITGEKARVPLYTIGKLYFPKENPQRQYDYWPLAIANEFNKAISVVEKPSYDKTRSVTYLFPGTNYMVFLYLDPETKKYNPDTCIGIAIQFDYVTYSDPSEIPADYTYPTSDEYYAMYSGKSSSKPTATPVPTATPTPKPTATPVPTATPTPEPTATPVPTATPTPKPTATPEPTATPTPEPTATPVPTATPTPEPTATPVPTATPTPEPTATPVPTATPTPEPAATPDVSENEGEPQDGNTTGKDDAAQDNTDSRVTEQKGSSLLYIIMATIVVGLVIGAIVTVRVKKRKNGKV